MNCKPRLLLCALLLASPASQVRAQDNDWIKRTIFGPEYTYWGSSGKRERNAEYYAAEREAGRAAERLRALRLERQQREAARAAYYGPGPRPVYYGPGPRPVYYGRNRVETHAQDGALCLTMVRAVGDQRRSQEAARKAASLQWQETVRFDYGEKYMDTKQSQAVSYLCSQSSVADTFTEKAAEAVGRPLYRCRLWARPCRASVEREREDE